MERCKNGPRKRREMGYQYLRNSIWTSLEIHTSNGEVWENETSFL